MVWAEGRWFVEEMLTSANTTIFTDIIVSMSNANGRFTTAMSKLFKGASKCDSFTYSLTFLLLLACKRHLKAKQLLTAFLHLCNLSGVSPFLGFWKEDFGSRGRESYGYVSAVMYSFGQSCAGYGCLKGSQGTCRKRPTLRKASVWERYTILVVCPPFHLQH